MRAARDFEADRLQKVALAVAEDTDSAVDSKAVQSLRSMDERGMDAPLDQPLCSEQETRQDGTKMVMRQRVDENSDEIETTSPS